MHLFTFYLILSLSKISEAFYSFQCPVQAHWKQTSEAMCDSWDNYYCLYDQNKNTFTEFCRDHPDFEAPGQKLIVAGSVKGTLQGADCDNDFYQPFQFLSSGSSRCVYEKSYCSGEGQIIFSNGTMEEDRLCRCDYRRGYDFIVRPKHQCYCVPTKEDCSCYIKLCSANDILSPDYGCLDKDKWKTSFKCDQLVNIFLPEEIELPSTVIPMLETYVSGIYDIENYRKEARYSVMLAILPITIAILVIGIFPVKCLSFISKHDFKDKKSPRKKNDTNMGTYAIEKAIDENEFEKKVDTIKGGMASQTYIREFQNNTLRDWCSKLDRFVITRAADIIYSHVLTKNVILIVGPTRIGKSILAYYVAVKLTKKDDYTIIPARQPLDIINNHLPDAKQIFIIDDFIGKYAVDETDAVSWEKHGPVLKILFDKTDQTKLILTSRTYIWQLEKYKYLNIPSVVCDLLSEELQLLQKERLEIFESYIKTDVHSVLGEECIMSLGVFPSICATYSSPTKVGSNDFFSVFCLIIEEEIHNFKIKSQVSFIALAILAIRQMIAKNSFTIDKHEHDELLQDLFNESNFLQYPSKNMLKTTLSALKGDYVKEIYGGFTFINETLANIVLYCIAKTFTKSVIKHCKTDVLLNKIRLMDEHEFHIIKVTNENKTAYFKRLVFELNRGLHKDVFESSQHKSKRFREDFLKHLKPNISRSKSTETQEEMTALHVVSGLGYHEYVRFFIHDKQLINARDDNGNIPLHLACINGHLQIVRDLIENNSSVDTSNNSGLKPFFYACTNGNVNVAKYMLHKSAKWINVNEKYKTQNKKSVLHNVCENGFSSLALVLLKNDADVDIKDADGCTPLHLACKRGSSATVSALLEKEANVNAVDSFGKSPVYCACKGNNERVVELLLKTHAIVNKRTVKGLTPLCVSCRNKNESIVKMLLQNGAKVNSHKPNVVPLHEACKVGNESIVNILIKSKASINHKTKAGVTPLHEACMNGKDSIVKILLDKKAVVNVQNKNGWTALLFSSSHGFHTTVDLLLHHNADLNMCDEDQINPLMIACKEDHEDVVNILLRSKADVNHSDKDNCSSLAFACKTGNEDVVNLLLKYGADVNFPNTAMISPLHIACMHRKPNIVLILINNKANINAQDILGQTPLFKSSLNGYNEIVEIILANGAAVDICDIEGISPMTIAYTKGHTDVVDAIRKYV